MWQLISSFATGLIEPVTKIIDQAVEDKDLANRLKAQMQATILANVSKEVEAARDVIVAEAQGESWLQRNWRPVVMLMFSGIIFNNYVLASYGIGNFIDMPEGMWMLLKLGLGGYVVGRSGEKIAKSIAPALKK